MGNVKGHQQIIAARMKGDKPAAVWIRAGMPETPVLSIYDEPEKALHFGFFPTVDIPESEVGTRLDLRFLLGLTVHIHGEAMTDKFMDLVDAVGAVAGHMVALAGDDLIEYKNGEYTAWTF